MAKKPKIQYFCHDADMRNNIKVRALREKFGNDGYAVWCYILETLCQCEGFEMEDSEMRRELMSVDFGVSVDRLNDILDYGKFVNLWQTDGKRIFCHALAIRFANLPSISHKRSEAGKRGAEARWRENTTKTDGNCHDVAINVCDSDGNCHDVAIEEWQTDGNEWQSKSKSKSKNIEIESNDSTKKSPKSRFAIPTITEVQAYITEKGFSISAESFVDYYEANGWKVGKNPMKDWKAAVRMWQSRRTQEAQAKGQSPVPTGVSLGVGEYINNQGIRTYGTGRAIIPMNAPARPSERHSWDAASQNWIML